MAAALLVTVWAVRGIADPTTCPKGLLCFKDGDLLSADGINSNFAALKTWLEQKVGSVDTPTSVTVGTLLGQALQGTLSVTSPARIDGVGGCYVHWGNNGSVAVYDEVVVAMAAASRATAELAVPSTPMSPTRVIPTHSIVRPSNFLLACETIITAATGDALWGPGARANPWDFMAVQSSAWRSLAGFVSRIPSAS
jgi:hypothetical protein